MRNKRNCTEFLAPALAQLIGSGAISTKCDPNEKSTN